MSRYEFYVCPVCGKKRVRGVHRPAGMSADPLRCDACEFYAVRTGNEPRQVFLDGLKGDCRGGPAVRTYNPPLGTGVDHVLKAMVEIADETGKGVTARFNGTTLTANPGDDFVVLAAQWWKDADAAHEAWKERASAEREPNGR